MSQVHRDDLVAGTSELFKTGDFSDLLIRCNDREFRVHRAIVCPRSKFFQKACTGGFNVCTEQRSPHLDVEDDADQQQEATSREINLGDDDPDTVARMLSYIYTTDYDDGLPRKTEGSDMSLGDTEAQGEAQAEAEEQPASEAPFPHGENAAPEEAAPEEETPTPAAPGSEHSLSVESLDGASTDEESDINSKARSALHNNALVYAIGEKYDVAGLKLLSKEYFSACAALHWPPDNLHEIIKLVYETTPDNDRGLREIVTNLCYPHLDELMESETFKATAIELSAFCYDILRESSTSADRTIVNLTIKLSDVESEKQDTETELTRTKFLVATLKTQLDQADQNINTINEITAQYPDCRHCDKPLRWFIDSGYYRDTSVVLRCKACNTRHHI